MERINSKVFFESLMYYMNYYGSEYKENQGLSEILEMIKLYSKGGSWIDLGGGTNTALWRMAFKRLNKICSVDLYKENFLLSELIINYFEESDCYKMAKKICNVNETNNLQITYEQKDLLNEKVEFSEKYDNITQFGLLGLLRNQNDFCNKSKEIISIGSSGSIYIGANWIFSKSYAEEIGFPNSYINIQLIEKIAKETKSSILNIKNVKIHNDEKYDKVVVYAFAVK